MTTKHEAMELAGWLTEVANTAPVSITKKQISRASDAIRHQHARIEELEREIQALLDGTQHCGEMQYVGPDELSPWERARATLTKKG